ncbi:MAG: hypothetical protein ABL921_05580 [Pirellula sp.]
MSNRIHISRIPLKSSSTLSAVAKQALIQAKNDLKSGVILPVFGNSRGAYDGDGSPLPQLTAGCEYLEVDVGQSSDPQPNRGTKRFVIEFHTASRRVENIYFTENHYLKFSFYRIV